MTEELDIVGRGTDWSLHQEKEKLVLMVDRPANFLASPRQVSVTLPTDFLDELFQQKGQIRRKVPVRTEQVSTPTPPKNDSIEEALRRACEEPTLAEALTWLAIWDCDRAVRQALRNEAARRAHREHPATSHGGLYETTFLICFKKLLERWDSSV